MNLRPELGKVADSEVGVERRGAPWAAAGREGRSGLGSLAHRALQVEALPVLIATIVLGLVIGGLRPSFLGLGNLHDVLQQSVYVAILAAGLAFLIGMREIDLSVGSVFALTLIIGALLMKRGIDPWLAVAIAIALGGVMGVVNAILVQVIAIPAIVATLATLSMFRGLALALTDGQQVTGLPVRSPFFTVIGGNLLGFPVTALVMIAAVIALTAALRLTPYGYRVRSIGSNPEAATFSGISIPRVRVQALAIMGLLGGLAGVLGLAFFQTGDPNIGIGLELQAIAAAVIGGTPLSGGRATVVGAMVGAILLSVVTNGLVYFNVPINWSQFATGAVILGAVGLDSVVRRRHAGAGLRTLLLQRVKRIGGRA
jgi:ribose transport system permease protein